MLVVLGAPALNACNGDDRGLLTCVRGLIDDRFDLGLEPDGGGVPGPAQPITIDAAPVEPLLELQTAEAIVPKPVVEPTRSLVAPAPEKPIAPPAAPPRVIPTPDAVALPDLPIVEPQVEAPVTDAMYPAPTVVPAPEIAGDDQLVSVPADTTAEPGPAIDTPDAAALSATEAGPPAEAALWLAPPETPPEPVAADPPLVAAPAPEEPTAIIPELQEPSVEAPLPEVAAIEAIPDAVPQAAELEIPAVLPQLPPAEPDAPVAAIELTFPEPDPVIAVEDQPVPAPVEADPPPVAVTAPTPDEPAALIPDVPEPSVDTPPPDLAFAVVEPETALPEMPATVPPSLPAEPEAKVAAIDPAIPAEPEITGPLQATPALAPTIDAIEIDGDGNFIAGNGPAGATMRLYVDGLPVGVSPVEGGRWLVEGTDLLTEEQQVLKVEALDPLTGRVLGEASVAFEGPIGAADAPVVEDEVQGESQPEDVPMEPLAAEHSDTVGDQFVPDPPAPLPPIVPVVPATESPSVTILGPAGDAAVDTLPTGDPSADTVSTLGTAPASPAIMAQFTLPAAASGLTVLRAVPVGDPGAGRFVSGEAIIRRGDTLWDIAHRFYGRGVHYRTILRANRELINRPGRIYPGLVIDLPLVYDD